MHLIDFYAVIIDPIPKRLLGADTKCAIRLLSSRERLEIEDRFDKQGARFQFVSEAMAVIVTQTFKADDDLEECAILIEFALAILTISGFRSVDIAAAFVDGNCVAAEHRLSVFSQSTPPIFAKSLTGDTATKWLVRFLNARGKISDRMHITADRFVRYSQGKHLADSLLDLCISLESLLDSQTEVSFRFGTCLTKVAAKKGKEAEEMAKLLSDLYDLRSKLAHGAPEAFKVLEKLQPTQPELRKIARIILTNYVLFISDHSRAEWKQHLHTLLFA